MGISKKIFVIVALLIVPIIILTYVFHRQSDTQIYFTEKELVGSDYLRALLPVLADVADNTAGAGARPDTAALSATNDRLGDELNSTDAGRALISRLAAAGKADEATMTTVIDLVTRIGNESNLILDPDLDSYYAMDVVVLKVPEVFRQMTLFNAALTAAADGLSPDEQDKIVVHKGLFTGVVDGLFASLQSVYDYDSGHDQKAVLAKEAGAFRAAADAFVAASNVVVDATGRDPAAVAAAIAPLEAARADLARATRALWTKIDERLDVITAARVARLSVTFWKLMGIAGSITILALGLAVFLALGIRRLISRSVAEMLRLANGDTGFDISGADRRDEIGSIAGALKVFRANLVREHELLDERQVVEAHQAAEAREARANVAATFEATVGGVIAALADRARDLETYAGSMHEAATETTTQAVAVASASEEASTSVEAVASAAEELSVSVREIAEQISRSSERAQTAVRTSADTVAKVNSLLEASRRIGDIVGLIEEIAGQTNLLALNATIEAARAGEAGKGFAVVAAEVKNLAAQTARATTEIGQQIGAIQSATTDSVASIDEISRQIHELDTIIGSVAASVEEQAAATEEISSSIQSASKGTVAVSTNISGVSSTAERSTAVAEQVRRSSADQLGEAHRLEEEVRGFIASLTAA
jgi:methyl-accepting chemotaxis protein